jgi:hypothetical protein
MTENSVKWKLPFKYAPFPLAQKPLHIINGYIYRMNNPPFYAKREKPHII